MSDLNVKFKGSDTQMGGLLEKVIRLAQEHGLSAVLQNGSTPITVAAPQSKAPAPTTARKRPKKSISKRRVSTKQPRVFEPRRPIDESNAGPKMTVHQLRRIKLEDLWETEPVNGGEKQGRSKILNPLIEAGFSTVGAIIRLTDRELHELGLGRVSRSNLAQLLMDRFGRTFPN